MSIQRTAESALQSLEELYRAIHLASQQTNPMSIDDSENLVQALCNLSHLIQHINQTGMCDQTSIHTTNFDSNRFYQKRNQTFTNPQLNQYDDQIYMNSVPMQQSFPNEPAYGECVLYHPIRIITTSADRPIVIHESDSVSKDRHQRRDHRHTKHFPYGRHSKINRRRMSRSHDYRSKRSLARKSRSGSRAGSRLSRGSRRSSRSRRSQARGRSSRSSRRSSSHRRSRSSQRRSRSRRRSSQKQQSSDRKYHDRQIPSRPIPTALSHPSNQISSTSTGNLPISQPYIRSVPSPTPNPTTSSSSVVPHSLFAPTIPLPPPPAASSLQHSHLSPQIPVHNSQNSLSRTAINPLNDQSLTHQQVTDSLLTSRSKNCPECRAITRLLQWAPLKCYDAAGIQRGVFLAGPKSEQLLKALYSSMKDSSFSLDDIEDCLCDNE